MLGHVCRRRGCCATAVLRCLRIVGQRMGLSRMSCAAPPWLPHTPSSESAHKIAHRRFWDEHKDFIVPVFPSGGKQLSNRCHQPGALFCAIGAHNFCTIPTCPCSRSLPGLGSFPARRPCTQTPQRARSSCRPSPRSARSLTGMRVETPSCIPVSCRMSRRWVFVEFPLCLCCLASTTRWQTSLLMTISGLSFLNSLHPA